MTDCRWVLLYVKRWLERRFGARMARLCSEIGEPARLGNFAGPGEPVHALRVRYVDGAEFPGCPFERFADDIVVHCKSRRQAEYVLAAIAARMGEVGLRIHPDKTTDRLLQGRQA